MNWFEGRHVKYTHELNRTEEARYYEAMRLAEGGTVTFNTPIGEGVAPTARQVAEAQESAKQYRRAVAKQQIEQGELHVEDYFHSLGFKNVPHYPHCPRCWESGADELCGDCTHELKEDGQ